MKVLIDNYTNHKTTEPLYLNRTLNTIGIENALWDKRHISFYDVMDRFNPDVFVTSIATLSNDILHYFKANKSSVDFITNITDASEEDLRTLVSVYEDCGINNKLLINNQAFCKPVGVPPSVNKQDIYYGADIFIQQYDNKLSNEIDLCVIVDGDVSESWVRRAVETKDPKSYHILSLDGQYQGKDSQVTLVDMANIYKLYKDISILSDKQSGIFTQLFFDLTIRGVDVTFTSLENLYNNDMLNDIKKNISSRHTCLNRVQTLLNKIGCKEEAAKVDALIGQVK